MNKRSLHHFSTKISRIKPGYFLILTLVFGVICIFALRANNQQMIKLRSDVFVADKNNSDVKGALSHLQAYVTTHMNTNLSSGHDAVYPPIQLKYTYERLAQSQANKQLSQNGNALYNEAQNYCETQNHSDFSGRNRVPCIEQYVQSHGGGEISIKPIPDALYKFDFVSPRWSPDLAGYTMALTVVSAILFVLTLVVSLVRRRTA